MKLLLKTLVVGYVAKCLTHYLLNQKKTTATDA